MKLNGSATKNHRQIGHGRKFQESLSCEQTSSCIHHKLLTNNGSRWNLRGEMGRPSREPRILSAKERRSPPPGRCRTKADGKPIRGFDCSLPSPLHQSGRIGFQTSAYLILIRWVRHDESVLRWIINCACWIMRIKGCPGYRASLPLDSLPAAPYLRGPVF